MISINYRGKSYFHGDVLEVTARLTGSEFVWYNLQHRAWTDALGRSFVCRTGRFYFLSISCPSTPGIGQYGVERVDTGETIDSKNSQENQGFPANPMKIEGGRSSVG